MQVYMAARPLLLIRTSTGDALMAGKPARSHTGDTVLLRPGSQRSPKALKL